MTRSGGHSEWSTIGSNGFIIDLSLYSSIEVHKEAKTVTIRGSVLAKPLAIALADNGMFTGKIKKALMTAHPWEEDYDGYLPGVMGVGLMCLVYLSIGQWEYSRHYTVHARRRRLRYEFHHRLWLRSDHFRAHDHR